MSAHVLDSIMSCWSFSDDSGGKSSDQVSVISQLAQSSVLEREGPLSYLPPEQSSVRVPLPEQSSVCSPPSEQSSVSGDTIILPNKLSIELQFPSRAVSGARSDDDSIPGQLIYPHMGSPQQISRHEKPVTADGVPHGKNTMD